MKINFIFILFYFLFTSCSESTQEPIPKNHIQINFSELIITLIDIDVEEWNQNNSRIYDTQDTALFQLLPGDGVTNKKILIKNSNFDNIEIQQQTVFKLAINTTHDIEVPVCILTNWKKLSDWRKISQNTDQFSFGEEENISTSNNHFSLQELKYEINQCGKEWLNDIKNIEHIKDLPVYEIIYQYKYKVIAKNSQTGKTIEKIIIFYLPTSC